MWSFGKDCNAETALADPFCYQHCSPFSLYCLEDEALVCSSCRLGRDHNEHEVWPVQQAAHVRKKIIRDSLKTLMEKQKGHNRASLTINDMVGHVPIQARQTEIEIKEEFKKLHRFLREEEEARIAALREQKEQKSQMLKKRIEKINKEMSSVSDTIKTIEQQLESDDITFLQNYLNLIKRTWHSLRDPLDSSGMFSSIVNQSVHQMKSFFSTPRQIHNATLARIYSTPLEPEPMTDGLINVAKHLGNLKYRVLEKMLGTVQYTPVTVDPNTAAPCLSLTEELTTIKYRTGKTQLPDNPERFNFGPRVFGSQSFTFGTHCWDVEVGDNSKWAVGVATQSVLRKKETIPCVSQCGDMLTLCYTNGLYSSSMGPVPMRYKPRRVRVELDCDSGNVTFSDPDWYGSISTSGFRVTEPVFPYFYSSCEEHPLKITPQEVRVSVEAPSQGIRRIIYGISNWFGRRN